MNGRTAWKTTTPPAVEPITLVDAKAELGIPTADTTQDARITRLITAARSMTRSEKSGCKCSMNRLKFPVRFHGRKPLFDASQHQVLRQLDVSDLPRQALARHDQPRFIAPLVRQRHGKTRR